MTTGGEGTGGAETRRPDPDDNPVTEVAENPSDTSTTAGPCEDATAIVPAPTEAAPELEGGRKTFYLMSAVVTHRDQVEDLREGLQNVVGDGYWHTTESLRTEDGRKAAVEVAEYLGDEKGSEVCIVSCKMPLGDEGGDSARQACFQQVATSLCTGVQPLEGAVHLMVLEQRETQHERSYDNKIVRDLRSAAVICRHCQLKQASPRVEPLLWLPDLVSSAVRRSITHNERDLLDPIDRIVTVLDWP